MQLAEIFTPVSTWAVETSMAQRLLSAAAAGASAMMRPPRSHIHLLTHQAAGLPHGTGCQALKNGGENHKKCLEGHLGQSETLSACGPRLSPGASYKPTQKSCAHQPRLTAEASLPAELSETHLNSQGKQGASRSLCCALLSCCEKKGFFPCSCL